MMHMTFYWGKSVTVLFDSWKTDSWLSYILTLLALFLFSVFYQYIEDRRLRFKFLSATAKPFPSSSPPSITTPLLHPTSNPARFASSILFGFNSAIGYLLMLAVMSYNGGVFIAVVLGLFVGYLIFRSGSNEDAVVVENPCACA